LSQSPLVSAQAGEQPLLVLYDGACPLCRREIALYRGLRGEQALRFVDVRAESALPHGTTREQLLARFHVQRADGTLASGADAFLTLWASLPGWRWLARAGRLPGMAWSMERIYRLFLRWRPALQRLARRLDHTGAPATLTPRVLADLRSDHAGETGAVAIYRGILYVARDSALRAFAQRHLHTEKQHLEQMQAWLPLSERSRLLPAWRAAGWVTGALPALFGPAAVYATIASVETFVDRHYAEQVAHLQGTTSPLGLLDTLLSCQADECAHRDEAASLTSSRAGSVLRLWCRLVGAGSAAAVALARRF
jgi:3-demethoxyubiquinol 3-hydroxylase